MNIVPEQAHEESVEALLAFTVDKRQRNAEAASPGMFFNPKFVKNKNLLKNSIKNYGKKHYCQTQCGKHIRYCNG